MNDSSSHGHGPSRLPSLLCPTGLLGVATMAGGVIVPALAYVGRGGHRFSPLNHFISELGEVGVSQLAWVFNGSLVLSGVLMALLLAVLGWRLGTRRGRAAGVFGVMAGVGAVGVGFTPMNDLVPHLQWAFVFFWGGLATVVLFASAVWRDGGRRLPRWLAGVGLASAVVFIVFLAWPFVFGPPDGRMLDPKSGIPRPTVWGYAVLEWLVLLSVMVFAASGAVGAGRLRLPEPERKRTPRLDNEVSDGQNARALDGCGVEQSGSSSGS